MNCIFCPEMKKIHEITISLRFLGIILRILKLEVSTLVLHFYKMLFMNKLEFSSLIDCFVWISETIGAWYGFLSGFPPFVAFLSVISVIRYKKTMFIVKGNNEDNVNKDKPPSTFSCKSHVQENHVGVSKVHWWR